MTNSGLQLSAIGVLLAAGLAVGCQTPRNVLTVQGVDFDGSAFTYETTLNDVVYRELAGGELQLAAQVTSTAAAVDGLREILICDIYWRSRAGVSYDDRSTANALVRYLITTDDGARYYDGSAFVYVKPGQADNVLICNFERVDLSLASTLGSSPDLHGRLAMTGELRATADAVAARRWERELEQWALDLETEVKAPQ